MKSGNAGTRREYWLCYVFAGVVCVLVGFATALLTRDFTFVSDIGYPFAVVRITIMLLAVTLIVGGVGLKYHREWARRLLDASAVIVILEACAFLGGRTRVFASLDPSRVLFIWEAYVMELSFVWLPHIALGSLARYQLWSEEQLAACRTDATRFSPAVRKTILARMAVVSVAAGFAGYLVTLAVSKHA